jgi:hypothetical protein
MFYFLIIAGGGQIIFIDRSREVSAFFARRILLPHLVHPATAAG